MLAAPTGKTHRGAALALLAGTIFWGCGFTWAKAGGEEVNRASSLGEGALFGPIFLLAIRFLSAGFFWLVIFPASRRGWSRRSFINAGIIGLLLSLGLITQHLGLDRTSEAVAAFLTSLTIVFVPLLMMLALRKPPPATVWVGVALAMIGVWLMTGATPTGFGVGEALGLGSAIGNSLYIISVNMIVPRESAHRMTAGQFIVIGIVTAGMCPFLPGGMHALTISSKILALPNVWINLALLVLFTTIGAYGLLTFFQPLVDPTRAALIYLVEPIFASVYAYLARGRTLGVEAILGGALIILANALVEYLEARAKRQAEPVGPV